MKITIFVVRLDVLPFAMSYKCPKASGFWKHVVKQVFIVKENTLGRVLGV
jgi:hypothetical protein